MEISSSSTVGEMAAQEYKALKLYKELGIEFCCGGGRNLIEVLGEKGVAPEAFAERLEALKRDSGPGEHPDFLAMTPEALADYIVEKHHRYLWEALPAINALFTKVLGVHGAHHPELFRVFKLFGQLKTDLEQHLVKEETMLFPRIAELRDSDDVRRLAEEIREEHETAGDLLEDIRAANRDYALPDDACASFTKLYTDLQAVEDDIHEHIHLENNILLRDTGPLESCPINPA